MDQPTAMANENAKELSPAQRSALDRIAALRNPEAHYLVYKITGPTGKIYIGYTGSSLARRWQRDGYYNKFFREDLEKYGKENFHKEVLCENLTKEGAEHLEYELIERLHARDPEIGYNSFTGGPHLHTHLSARSRMLHSSIQTPDGPVNLTSERMKRYCAEHPEAVKAQAEKRRLRYANSPELVEECRRRSKESKPLRCVETGEIYPSVNKCASAMGITRIVLSDAANNPERISCGYHWEWVKSDTSKGS